MYAPAVTKLDFTCFAGLCPELKRAVWRLCTEPWFHLFDKVICMAILFGDGFASEVDVIPGALKANQYKPKPEGQCSANV